MVAREMEDLRLALEAARLSVTVDGVVPNATQEDSLCFGNPEVNNSLVVNVKVFIDVVAKNAVMQSRLDALVE